jgi:chaperonin GroES
MKIKPLGNNVLLKPEKITEKTESGFVLPESADKTALFGTVEGIGKEAEDTGLEIGQRVTYSQYCGTQIGEFLLIACSDIMGIIKEEEKQTVPTWAKRKKCKKCGTEGYPMKSESSFMPCPNCGGENWETI